MPPLFHLLPSSPAQAVFLEGDELNVFGLPSTYLPETNERHAAALRNVGVCQNKKCICRRTQPPRHWVGLPPLADLPRKGAPPNAKEFERAIAASVKTLFKSTTKSPLSSRSSVEVEAIDGNRNSTGPGRF